MLPFDKAVNFIPFNRNLSTRETLLSITNALPLNDASNDKFSVIIAPIELGILESNCEFCFSIRIFIYYNVDQKRKTTEYGLTVKHDFLLKTLSV